MKVRPVRRPTCRKLLTALTAFCRPALGRGVRASGADRYVKRYASVEFALALISYYLLGLSSLRELKGRLDADGALARRVRLRGISHAQLPKLLHARPAALWGPLVAHLLARLSARQVPSGLRVLDTSFFVSSAKLLGRACQRGFAPAAAGVKLALAFDPQTIRPLRWQCRVGQGSDAGQGRALLPAPRCLAGQTYLFDRGFRNYAFYQELIDRQAQFITRASALIHYQVQQSLPLEPAHPQIVADERVRLGSAQGHNRMRSDLRRIVLRTAGEDLVFLTSDGTLSAWEVTELYRQRWAIEVFFRWLKRVVGCVRPLGYSAQAAQHTLYAALVAYLLALLLTEADSAGAHPGPPRRLKSALRRLAVGLYQRPTRQQLLALGFR